jgi:hypothetical protein
LKGLTFGKNFSKSSFSNQFLFEIDWKIDISNFEKN